jgi:HK97 family phage prohead protease
MPNPADYSSKNEFISDCISTRQHENPDEKVEQSTAICYSLWSERSNQKRLTTRQTGPDFDETYSEFMDRCVREGGDVDECQDIWDTVNAVMFQSSEIPNLERRVAQLEIRARGRRLEGYAATFGTWAQLDGFSETIAPGAFRSSLAGDVLALLDHDPAKLLARTKSKTLRLSEDSKGLAFDLDVPATSVGNDVLALARRNDLGGMSFGFHVPRGGDFWDGDKRTLRSIDLREISVVSAWPAYSETTVVARSKSQIRNFRLALAKRFVETL